MAETNRDNRMVRQQQVRLDWYTIIRDIAKEWQTIIMISLAAFFFSFFWQYTHYAPTFTITTTFTVSTKGSSTDVYTNLSSAADTATSFTQIINSEVLQKKVAEEIGLPYMPGSVTSEAVENTNLLNLTVVENDPKLAYQVLHAVLNNYNKVSTSLLGNVVINTLIKPELPEHADVLFSPWGGMIKSMIEMLVIVIFLIGLVSFFKDTVRREFEVEQKLDTKLLGTLCHEEKYQTIEARIKKRKKSILIQDPMVSFRYSESMKKLASKVSSTMKKRRAKTVLITSVLENEGKSTVAANLALALAEESAKVLLIDGDFRKPSIYKIFRIDSGKIDDFGEVLNGKIGDKKIICKKTNSNLSMVLNSIRYPDSTDLIGQPIMKKVLDYFKRYYDYIIIDSSPMALVADTQELLGVTDAAIIVVKQHTASVRDVNDAISLLNRNNMKLLGCVFNDAGGENSRFSYGAYGRYGKYSSYGSYGRHDHGYGKYEYGARLEAGQAGMSAAEVEAEQSGMSAAEVEAEQAGMSAAEVEAEQFGMSVAEVEAEQAGMSAAEKETTYEIEDSNKEKGGE